MNGSQGSGKERGDRRTETEAPPQVPQSQESRQPWKWRPEDWESYWRQGPTSPLDLATAG
jgi:hypothetical protein